MASNKIKLMLDHHSNIYRPGQTISGQVECFFTMQENFGPMRIAYTGTAETKWTRKKDYYDESCDKERTREVEYSDKEVYLNVECVLVEGGDNYGPVPDKHTYPFTYDLPQQIPSSFEGMYGNVRYKVKAVMDHPWMSDYESEIAINVVSPLDLNRLSHLRAPAETSIDSTPCSFWCQNSGPITFSVSLPATGFVPGQKINIGAYVENMSNLNVENVKFQIIAKYEYIAVHATNQEVRQITECTSGAVGAHGDKSWTEALTIPMDTPTPNLFPCRIINVNYILNARAELPFPHEDLVHSLKIMIGTVPLAGVNTSSSVPPALQSNSDSYAPTAPSMVDDSYAPSSSGGINNPYGVTLTPSQLEYGFSWSTNPSDASPYPSGADLSSAPPSYEEAKQLKQKDVERE